MAISTRILDFLLHCVDTFFECSIYVRIIVLIFLVTYLIQVITLSTTGWLQIQVNGQDSREGLWNRCTDTGDYTCCQTVDSFLYDEQAGVPGQLDATRAFLILGLITGFTALLLMMLESLCRLANDKPHLLIASCSLEFITSVLLFLGIVIYGGGYRSNAWLKESGPGASFVFVIFVMLSYIVLGAISVYEIVHRKRQVNPPAIQVQQASPANIISWNVRKPNQAPSLPTTWDKMTKDLLIVNLRPNSDEYVTVKREFMGTIDNTPVNIKKIERIQIKSQYIKYATTRDTISSKAKCTKIERRLWHGTAAHLVDSIITNGFDRGYSGNSNAAVYGNGVYFAARSSYSAQLNYSPPDSQGDRKMFLCSVLTGDFTPGKQGMRVLPFQHGQVRYDSAVDNMNNPSIFIIFSDTQAYPSYLITFR